MDEKYDSRAICCISKQQKAALVEYCWQHRVSQSDLLRNCVENVLMGKL